MQTMPDELRRAYAASAYVVTDRAGFGSADMMLTCEALVAIKV